MRTVNPVSESLKLIVQPNDCETHLILHQLGFQKLKQVPQLFYRPVDGDLSDLFVILSQQLSEGAQQNSRFIATRSPLDSQAVLIEFLSAQPLSQMISLISHAWFFQVLAQRRLFFHYQPIVQLQTGAVVAHECLARAALQEQQFSGQQLINAALSMNLTHEFDYLARTTCLFDIAKWCRFRDASRHRFFINVLPNAIAQDPGQMEVTFQQVLELGLSPKQIVFELTEVEALQDHPHLPQVIDRIRAWGFGLALDDLGSNVTIDHYCTEFYPDVIKLDRRLIHGCSRYELKQVMVKSLLRVAHELEISVLAEGLQSQEDIEFCRTIGIDLGQGFGLGLPKASPWKPIAESGRGALSCVG